MALECAAIRVKQFRFAVIDADGPARKRRAYNLSPYRCCRGGGEVGEQVAGQALALASPWLRGPADPDARGFPRVWLLEIDGDDLSRPQAARRG